MESLKRQKQEAYISPNRKRMSGKELPEGVRFNRFLTIWADNYEKNYRMITDLDILILREGRGQTRSEKILELIEKETTAKRNLINGNGSSS